MAKFTKGPWKVSRTGLTVFDTDGKAVASLEWRKAEERKASAQLIAAAPEMYELLKAYEAWEAKLVENDDAWGKDGMPWFTQGLFDEWMELQAKRNAVIDRAKGAEQ